MAYCPDLIVSNDIKRAMEECRPERNRLMGMLFEVRPGIPDDAIFFIGYNEEKKEPTYTPIRLSDFYIEVD